MARTANHMWSDRQCVSTLIKDLERIINGLHVVGWTNVTIAVWHPSVAVGNVDAIKCKQRRWHIGGRMQNTFDECLDFWQAVSAVNIVRSASRPTRVACQNFLFELRLGRNIRQSSQILVHTDRTEQPQDVGSLRPLDLPDLSQTDLFGWPLAGQRRLKTRPYQTTPGRDLPGKEQKQLQHEG